MDRDEMINEVVKEYFRGGNWQKYIKELVREENLNENNTYSADNVCDRVVDDVAGIE